MGYSLYTAWPALLLVALWVVCPALVFNAFRLLGYETSGGAELSGAVVLMLAAAGGLALLAVGWMAVVVLVTAMRKVSAPGGALQPSGYGTWTLW